MKQYLQLLKHIKENGTKKPAARAGMPGTRSIFGYQFRHNLADGFPLLTTKEVFWKGVVIELLWFLKGDTNVKYLNDNGVSFWNEDAYNYYKKISAESDDEVEMMDFDKFVETLKDPSMHDSNWFGDNGNYIIGDCGHQYGKTWRDFSGKKDQIEALIDGLKNSPEGRRHLLTAIDPANDQDLALYWCHVLAQFNCRAVQYFEGDNHYGKKGKFYFWITKPKKVKWYNKIVNFILNKKTYRYQEIDATSMEEVMNDSAYPTYFLDCQMYQRSADVVLGVPLNIASYALLTELLCKICNFIPGDYIHTFGDVHIYDNHLEAVEEQLKRKPSSLPKLHVLQRHKEHGSLPDHLEKYLVGRYDLNNFIHSLSRFDFRLEKYNPQSKIKAKLSTGLK